MSSLHSASQPFDRPNLKQQGIRRSCLAALSTGALLALACGSGTQTPEPSSAAAEAAAAAAEAEDSFPLEPEARPSEPEGQNNSTGDVPVAAPSPAQPER